jgi:XRE family transcriptional regulator, regulator of sulfur utilization
MIRRRDVAVALIASLCTAGGFAVADELPFLGPAVFERSSIAAKATAVGEVRSFFTMKTATLDQLEVHETTLNPGKSPHPPHKHPNEEMLVIRQGTVEALVKGEWKRVGPGSIVFNASNQLHGLKNVGTEPAIYTVINFKTDKTPAE